MTNYRIDPSFPVSTHIEIPIDECKVEQIYSLEEMLGGDEAGTTDTDSKTESSDGGYTTIYRKYR